MPSFFSKLTSRGPRRFLMVLLAAWFFLSLGLRISWGVEHLGQSAEPGQTQSEQAISEPSDEPVVSGSPRPDDGGAQQAPGPPPGSMLKRLILWFHIMFVAGWVGSHAYLLFVFPRSLLKTDDYTERVLHAYRSFSRFIIPVFTLLVLTGFGNIVASFLEQAATGEQPSPEAFAAFLYLFLLPKLSLASIGALVGAMTSFYLLPKLKSLFDEVKESSGGAEAAGQTGAGADGSAGGQESLASMIAKRVRAASVINFAVGVAAIFVAVRGLF